MQCQTFEQYSVDYLEGTLSPRTMHDADAHLQCCAHCRALLAEARMVSEALRRLPQESCPDHIVEQVMQQQALRGARSVRVSWSERLSQWFGPVHIRRFGLATVAVLLVVVTVWQYQRGQHRPVETETYSAAEVEQAKREIELTLAYLHRYMQQTSTAVEYQLASTQTTLTEPVHTILAEQIQSTQTAVRRPMQTLITDAAAPFEAAASYLGGKL